MDKDKNYGFCGCDSHLIKSVMKRLYSEKRMPADDMRDCAHKLYHFLNEVIVELEEAMTCPWCDKEVDHLVNLQCTDGEIEEVCPACEKDYIQWAGPTYRW